MKSVFIVGEQGTTGLRLRERLLSRGDVRLVGIEAGLRKDTGEILRLMEGADFAFLCLPDAAAREIAGLSEGLETRVIDTSTAHRTCSAWAYGFPELSVEYRVRIAKAGRVASPGCHASGFVALVRPLVSAGVLGAGAFLSCTSLTGYSGGGKAMIAQYEDLGRAPLLDASRLYAMGQGHKHLPEMMVHGGVNAAPVFLPVVGDFYSGMLVAVPVDASMLGAELDCEGLREIYRGYYAGSVLVGVSEGAPEGLYAGQMSGRDDMTIFVSGSEGRFLLCALFDNLGKGASGAAIQCFNIMCGLPEDTGLVLGGLHNGVC